MLKQLDVKNLTVFSDARLKFSNGLNVIVGENGTGKTHLLKLAYSVLAASWEEGRKPGQGQPTKSALQLRIAEKLIGVFRPEGLGRLARRKQGRERCEIMVSFRKSEQDLAFSFATPSKTEVVIETLPKAWVSAAPVYLPTRELLTIYPGFVSVYEGHYLEFEETWRDTCVLLGAPLSRGPKEAQIQSLLSPIETAMGGSLELDKNGRFYLNLDGKKRFKLGAGSETIRSGGRIEVPLVAEGLRKLGMLGRLVATGALLDKGCLFWDEPEANLNPKLIKEVAKTILGLCKQGLQVFVATHSLFLLREFEILTNQKVWGDVPCRYFGLHPTDNGVVVDQGTSVDDIGDIAALEESLQQSDRYLAGMTE